MNPLLQLDSESRLAGRYETLVRVSQVIGAHHDPKTLFSKIFDLRRKEPDDHA